MRAPRARLRGLSLIEVLIALCILSVSLLALIPMFSLGVKMNASSNELGMGNTLAGEKLEQLTAYPTTDPRLSVPVGQTTVTYTANDLPLWYKPGPPFDTSNGYYSFSTTQPSGGGWYPYPYSRTYTVSPFRAPDSKTLTAVASTTANEATDYNVGTATPYYNVKLVTVTVQPRTGALPGLRRTIQSAYLRYRNALN